jgi:hypothetical protein
MLYLLIFSKAINEIEPLESAVYAEKALYTTSVAKKIKQ